MATRTDFGRTDITATAGRVLEEKVLVVDISATPAKAKVVREGYQVPAVKPDAKRADFFLDNLPVVDVRRQPRVLSQSIPAGTKVTRGTVVDLVLAPSGIIPFGIFDGIHVELAGRPLDTLINVLDQNPQARQTVLQYERVEDVPAAEREVVRAQLAQADIGIDDADPQRSFAAAFQSARTALAFK